jgi:hypothetical protein
MIQQLLQRPSVNSPACSCVSITLPPASQTRITAYLHKGWTDATDKDSEIGSSSSAHCAPVRSLHGPVPFCYIRLIFSGNGY